MITLSKKPVIMGASMAAAHFGSVCLAWKWWDATSLATRGTVPFWVQAPSLVLGLPLVLPWVLTGQMKYVTFSVGPTIDILLVLTVLDSMTWGAIVGALVSRLGGKRETKRPVGEREG